MQTYQLKYPFTTAAAVRLEKVEIRRLTRGDLRKANAYSKDEFGQENFMLASMCGVTPEDLEGFDLADYKALAEFFRTLVDGKGESTNV